MKVPKFVHGLVFGITLVSVVLPILNMLLGLLELFSEALTSKTSVYISKNNVEIQKLSSESDTNVIGFDLSSPSEYDDEYDEDEEYKNKGRKIGFNV